MAIRSVEFIESGRRIITWRDGNSPVSSHLGGTGQILQKDWRTERQHIGSYPIFSTEY